MSKSLDKSLEEAWRGLITDDVLVGKKSETKRPNLYWFKKRLDETRQGVADRKAALVFAELHLAAGERVLKEYE